jgi:hypothetical protein
MNPNENKNHHMVSSLHLRLAITAGAAAAPPKYPK